ncbi:hypothetical protein FACS189490_11880 [Clostridia bacterium]|nr:hypothetical protein FACS189490_11880 [Clostridia bacterium]
MPDGSIQSTLIKQMWSMGIRDKQLISIVREMLKAPIKMPGGEIIYPTKGTPQGGILSPLCGCLSEQRNIQKVSFVGIDK